MYRPLSQSQSEIFLTVVYLEKSKPETLNALWKDMSTEDFICRVIQKRITAFKLPEFSIASIILLSILVEGNPGKAVLAMIECLEKAEELKAPITSMLICEDLYPMGFYTQSEFEKRWEERKANKIESKYNCLIC